MVTVECSNIKMGNSQYQNKNRPVYHISCLGDDYLCQFQAAGQGIMNDFDHQLSPKFRTLQDKCQ